VSRDEMSRHALFTYKTLLKNKKVWQHPVLGGHSEAAGHWRTNVTSVSCADVAVKGKRSWCFSIAQKILIYRQMSSPFCLCVRAYVCLPFQLSNQMTNRIWQFGNIIWHWRRLQPDIFLNWVKAAIPVGTGRPVGMNEEYQVFGFSG
jgi:hypothetical protein